MADPRPGDSTRSWLADLRVAAIFLTRVPIPFDGTITTADLRDALRANPVIGLAIGAVGGVVLIVTEAAGVPLAVGAGLAIAATVALTGALHEDGLADVADGFGGGSTPEEKLTIMRDSRIGTYGTLAVVLSVGLRWAALASFAGAAAGAAALIASHAFARGALPFVMTRFDAVRREGLGTLAGTPDRPTAWTALILGAAIALLFLGPVGGPLSLALAGAAIWVTATIARRQIGAIEQIAEIAILIAAVIAR